MHHEARAIDRRERRAIEIDVGRTRFTHPDRQQGIVRRHRKLAVDEKNRASVLTFPQKGSGVLLAFEMSTNKWGAFIQDKIRGRSQRSGRLGRGAARPAPR